MNGARSRITVPLRDSRATATDACRTTSPPVPTRQRSEPPRGRVRRLLPVSRSRKQSSHRIARSAALRLLATQAVRSLLFVESGHLPGAQRLSLSGRLLSQREHAGRVGRRARRGRLVCARRSLQKSGGSQSPITSLLKGDTDSRLRRALLLRSDCLQRACKQRGLHSLPPSAKRDGRRVGPAARTDPEAGPVVRAIGIRRCGRPPPRPVAAPFTRKQRRFARAARDQSASRRSPSRTRYAIRADADRALAFGQKREPARPACLAVGCWACVRVFLVAGRIVVGYLTQAWSARKPQTGLYS